jgi:hypothetical protein
VSAEAWIVECKGCKCSITACAIDPQDEHGTEKRLTAPLSSALVSCPCCGGDYRYAGDIIVRGQPKRNSACMRKQQSKPMDGALLIAASILASINLRGYPIENSPKVAAAIGESLRLARMVLARMERAN